MIGNLHRYCSEAPLLHLVAIFSSFLWQNVTLRMAELLDGYAPQRRVNGQLARVQAPRLDSSQKR
jgi:hypothetical protein